MPALKSDNAWITAAADEDSAIQAAVLCKSLNRVITMADTVVMIPENFDKKLSHLLENCFDSVIRVGVTDIENMQKVENAYLVDTMKAYAFNFDNYKKVAVLSPNNLILQNCDELFQMEKDYYIPDMSTRENSTLPPIFVIKPNADIYDQITPEFVLHDIFAVFRGLCPEGSVGKLSNDYNIHVNDLNATARPMKTFKVISHGHLSQILTNDNPFIQEVNELWNSSWVEIHNFLTREPINGGVSSQQKKDKNPYKTSIAIIGHSCRFPEANDNDEFWQLLVSGGDGIKRTPPERLELLKIDEKNFLKPNGGFLKCPIEEFDASFFGLSEREAELMDPGLRLLLEVTWEALENAAINANCLKSAKTGIFSGIWGFEYERNIRENVPKQISEDLVAETTISSTPVRISKILAQNGVNIAKNHEDSSSMVALHAAIESLKSKETDLGLVMGINLIEDVENMNKEFTRAEGIAVIVLKRLSDAVANGDRVMGIIRGGALNNQATSTSNKIGQQSVIREALKNSEIGAEDVDYIETHGTGKSPGDPHEFAAISAGYTGKREKPLIIGSVQPNIGHTESAAGLAGIIKVLSSLKYELIPRNRNIAAPNEKIHLEKIPAILPLENEPWKRHEKRIRMAGVNSFESSGANVHFVIEEPPAENKFSGIKLNFMESERSHHILKLSAKTDKALEDLSNSYVGYLSKKSEIDIRDLTFSASTGRAPFKCRASAVGKDIPELVSELEKKEFLKPILTGPPKIALLFTGQVPQLSNLSDSLYKTNPVFKDAFDECSKIVEKKTEIILKDVLWKRDKDDEVDWISGQYSILAVEYSLMKLIFSLGIKPNFVLGHGVGEYAAAIAAGFITLETAYTFLITKSKLVVNLPERPLVAVYCTMERLFKLISQYIDENPKDRLHIAAVPSEEEMVVGGCTEMVNKFKTTILDVHKMEHNDLYGSHDFNSPDMKSIGAFILKTTSAAKYRKPTCKFVSGHNPQGSIVEYDEMKEGKYWVEHIRETFNFRLGVKTLMDNNCNVYLEIGPRPNLLCMGKGTPRPDDKKTLWLPTVEEDQEAWEVLLKTLGTLYVNDVNVNWDVIDRDRNRKKLELPTYPFQREKYWINVPKKIRPKEIHPLLGVRSSESTDEIKYTKHLNLDELDYLREHQVANLVIVPGAGLLEIMLAAGRDLLQRDGKNLNSPLEVSNLLIQSALEIEEGKILEMQVVALATNKILNTFSVTINTKTRLNSWRKHASATVSLIREGEFDVEKESFDAIKKRCPQEKPLAEFYKFIADSGIQFGPKFKSMSKAWGSKTDYFATVPVKSFSLEGYLYHPIVLDAMLQAGTANTSDVKKDAMYLPLGLDRSLAFRGELTDTLYIHALQPNPKRNCHKIALYNKHGEVIFVILGLNLVKTSMPAFINAMKAQKNK